ncbi:glycosyltransferase [Fibrella arboris]|uniref:glycosyltransferase n=1 Tax=Fibrella arboris TaxID=3242486 RepID=UPI003522D6B7
MHIVYPIGTFYPAQSGGPSNSLYWLACALVATGVRVTVVTTATDQPPETPLDQWLDTEAGRVRYVRTWQHTLSLGLFWHATMVLRRADVVHLTSFFYPPSMLLALVALWLGRRVVWSPRGEVDPGALVYSPCRKRWILALIRRFRHRLVFHTTCAAETQYVREQVGADSVVIELPNFLILQPRQPHLPANYLLYMGRIHPKKGIDHLIEAFNRSLVARQRLTRLLIAGEANHLYADQLRKKIAALGLVDRIDFVGLVTGVDKERLLANAHALVMPSHTENFGNVVVEALAQGTPVIASTGTPWGVLPQVQAGFWVDNDPDTLASCLDTCLSLPEETYAAYRRQAAELARKQFDVYANIHHWTVAYTALFPTQPSLALCAE